MERRAAQDESRLQKALARLTANACELMLARHGETDWNTEHRLQGQLLPGPSLNAQGLQQAEELSSRLAEEKFDAIYTSDLARTLETVDQIKCNHPLVPVTVLTSLRERNLGVLQGLTMGEAAEAYPQTVAKLSSPETSHISVSLTSACLTPYVGAATGG